MKKTYKLKKGQEVFDKKRDIEIINYINKCFLKKGDNTWKPIFKKDIKIIIIIE